MPGNIYVLPRMPVIEPIRLPVPPPVLDRNVQWTIEKDAVLLSLIHVSKDGIGGFNHGRYLQWPEICEQLKADRATADDFDDYTPENIQARWDHALREVVRKAAEEYWVYNSWGTNTPSQCRDMEQLRRLLQKTYLGGFREEEPPLTWAQIADALNGMRDQFTNLTANFPGFTSEYVSLYYYYQLAPQMIAALRIDPAGRARALHFKSPWPRITYPEDLFRDGGPGPGSMIQDIP